MSKGTMNVEALRGEGAIDSALADRIVAEVREDELVASCCDLVNIPSPTGRELDMAVYMQAALSSLGMEVTWQEVEEGRANVIGRWPGAENGPNLMFNGHMDTSNSGDEPFLTGLGYKPHAVVRDGLVYGLGVYNMKGALACYMHAVKALRRAGVRLRGDVIIAAVVGEIEKTQFAEFRGASYRGYGAGTHYLVNHGILPDMCILGEPTDMQLVLQHFGSLWVRFSVQGTHIHTAFAAGRESDNAIARMNRVLADVLEWIPEWNLEAACGERLATVNLGAIRAGHAWRASRTPDRADLFLDVRVPPSMPMNQARRRIKDLYHRLRTRHPAAGLEFETYVSVPGAEIDPGHPMVRAIATAHAAVVHTPPGTDTVLWCSDASVLSRFGIPTINYGPSSGPRDAEGEKVRTQTFVDITRVYALAAAELCGVI